MRKELPEDIAERLALAGPVLDALGPVIRQNIIMMFEPGEEVNIKSIADQFKLSRTAVVHHINSLVEAGILRGRRVGKEVLLTLDLTVVAAAVETVENYVEKYGNPAGEVEIQ